MSKPGTATVRIGVAAASVAALAACNIAGNTETGPARPDGREISVKTVTGRITPPAQWPDACSLLTEDELRAVVPSAEDIEVISQSVKPYFLNRLPGETNAKLQQEAPGGRCVYKLELPADHKQYSSVTDGTGKFSVTLVAVGDPSVTARYYAELKASRAGDGPKRVDEFAVGGADCRLHSRSGTRPEIGGITCRKGPTVFAVGEVTFRDVDFEGVDHGAHDDFERAVEERILKPVAETVAADLPDA